MRASLCYTSVSTYETHRRFVILCVLAICINTMDTYIGRSRSSCLLSFFIAASLPSARALLPCCAMDLWCLCGADSFHRRWSASACRPSFGSVFAALESEEAVARPTHRSRTHTVDQGCFCREGRRRVLRSCCRARWTPSSFGTRCDGGESRGGSGIADRHAASRGCACVAAEGTRLPIPWLAPRPPPLQLELSVGRSNLFEHLEVRVGALQVRHVCENTITGSDEVACAGRQSARRCCVPSRSGAYS